MKRVIIMILMLAAITGCKGSFLDATDYFTGPVTGVGLKSSTAIASGGTEQLSAVIVPVKTSNKNAAWSCTPSNGSVVAVDASTGLVTAVAAPAHGLIASAIVTVTTAEGGFTASCNVTVTEKPIAVTSLALNKNVSYLVVGGVEQLSSSISPSDATDQTITWASSAPDTVLVDQTGCVTAKQAGSATIIASVSNGIKATCTITVTAADQPITAITLNKSSTVIAVGKTETLYAILTPSNATNQNIEWTSSDPSIAKVSSTGLVTAVAADVSSVTITAKTTDGTNLSATASVIVSAATVSVTGVSLARSTATVAVSKQTKLVASIAPTNATDQTLIWTSSSSSAVVDASGTVTGVAAGTATITVKTNDGSYAKICVVSVTADPTYSVTYDINGGTSGTGTVPADYGSYLSGSSVTIAAGTGLSNNALVFGSWNTQKGGGGTSYAPGTTLTMGSADVTLYAQYVSGGASLSTDATLSALLLSTGSVTPTFASETTAYSVSVPSATTSLSVTPIAASSTSTVKVNGAAVANGASSGLITLSLGANMISVVVTAQDTSVTKTYTITVTKLDGNADLSGLALSAGTLSPVFAVNTTAYTVEVPYTTASTTVTPSVSGTATVKVNGTAVTSGSASGSITLSSGSNMIAVVVTAQDTSVTKSYTITVTRTAASANAKLAGLTLPTGITLSPAFDPDTVSYNAEVASTVSSITVTPTAASSFASIQVNASPVVSGSASVGITLAAGTNTITVVVTAQDASTKTYTIIVTKLSGVSHNANLSGLSLSAGTLSPVFAVNTITYTAQVTSSTSSITITPTAEGSGSTIKVNNTPLTDVVKSAEIAISLEPTIITVVVTAADTMTSKTYTITVNRLSSTSSDANLAGLSLSAGTLSPVFAVNTMYYTSQVPSTISSITVTPTVEGYGATVTVNSTGVASGTASGNITLATGVNTIPVTVTAQDGTVLSYVVVVTKLATAVSSDANLAGLSLSTGTLSPTFTSSVFSYSTQLHFSSLTVTPTVSGYGAAVTVNSTAVTSGTASGSIALSGGTNTITVIVTAQNGTKKTYTITAAFTPWWVWVAGSSGTGTKNPATDPPTDPFVPGARYGATSWADTSGNFWLFGGYALNQSSSLQQFNDLWKYNCSTTSWTLISGSVTPEAEGVYGTQGTATRRNVPGARANSVGWIDSDGNLWLFGGDGYDSSTSHGFLNDLWKFNTRSGDADSNMWTWISGSSLVDKYGTYGTGTGTTGTPGARLNSVGGIDTNGNIWIFGGFGAAAETAAYPFGDLNDLWKYNTSSNTWIWISGDSSANKLGIYGTGTGTTGTPGARQNSVGGIDTNGNIWIFGGSGYGSSSDGRLNDLWKYNTSSNTWTWVSGSSSVNETGTYGTMGTASGSNVPGVRESRVGGLDADGNFWVFGGYRTAGSSEVYLNDLWKFNTRSGYADSNMWTWISGSNSVNQAGIYGVQGTAGAGNFPGSRKDSTGTIDGDGNLWIFGGEGYDASTSGELNDLWKLILKN